MSLRFKPGSSSDKSQTGKDAQDQPQLLMTNLADTLKAHVDAARRGKITTADEEVDERIDCPLGGYFQVNGVESEESSQLILTYSACRYDNFLLNGKYAALITFSGDLVNEDIYYDRFNVTKDGERWVISGYSLRDYDYYSSHFSYVHYVTLTNESQSEQYKLENFIESTNYSYSYVTRFDGILYIGSLGKVTVTPKETGDWSGQNVRITGSSSITGHVDFHDYGIIVGLDNNGDDEADLGVILADIYQLDDFATTAPTFVSIENLNFPPQIYNFFWQDWSATTLTPLNVNTPDVYDPESDPITITYEWYVNDIRSDLSSSTTFPARVAVYGDIVKVVAVASDGVNSTRSTLSFTLNDAPGIVEIDTPPTSAAVGELVQFSAIIIDPDNHDIPQPLPMVSAPPGAVIDADGMVEWVAVAPVLGNTMSYRFIFDTSATSSYPESTTERSVTVTDATKKMPIASSDIKTSSLSHSLWVSDFDGDGDNEILTTDGIEQVMLLSFNDADYQQSWLYPLSLKTDNRIVRVLPANLDEDAADEILVVGSSNINIIFDLDKVAEEIVSLDDEYFLAAQVADIDADGRKELIAVVNGSIYTHYNSQPRLVVYRLPSGEILRNINIVSPAADVVVGNVDQDAALEIVLSNGLVYDTATWVNQWYFGNGFGERLSLGDVNNDGIDEILGYRAWNNVNIFDAVGKVLATTIDNLNICSILAANVDQDPQDEVLVGDCNWNGIRVYDLVGGSPVLEQTLGDNEYLNSYSGLAVGDSDNDGEIDIHWSGGQSNLAVFSNDTQWVNTNDFERFNATGWISRTPDDEPEAIFIANQVGTDQGQRLVFMKDDGSREISPAFNTGSSRGQGVVTDYNQDGYGDIFLVGSEHYYYANAFQVYQLSDMSQIWTSGSSASSNNLRAPGAFDINGDGVQDGIYLDTNKLIMADVNDAVILSNDIIDASNIQDYAIVNRPGLEAIDVVVASAYDLQVWRKEDASFVKVASTQRSCNRILVREDNGQVNIYCYQYYYSNTLQIMSYQDTVFSESIDTLELPGYVRDMTFSSDPEHPSYLYFGALDISGYDDYFIGVIDVDNGNLLGRMDVMGSLDERNIFHRVAEGGKPGLMFGTSTTMYLVH